MRLLSLEGRMTLLLGAVAIAAVLIFLGITVWPLPALVHGVQTELGLHLDDSWLGDPVGGLLLTTIVLIPLCAWLAHLAGRCGVQLPRR